MSSIINTDTEKRVLKPSVCRNKDFCGKVDSKEVFLRCLLTILKQRSISVPPENVRRFSDIFGGAGGRGGGGGGYIIRTVAEGGGGGGGGGGAPGGI